jgi:hypothetical protein
MNTPVASQLPAHRVALAGYIAISVFTVWIVVGFVTMAVAVLDIVVCQYPCRDRRKPR